MKTLEGKVAVITGGSSGIGLATAKRFVAEGAHVYITGRSKAGLEAAAREIGSGVTAVQADASKPADLDRLYDQIKRERGKLDTIFVNAGGGTFVPLGHISEDFYNTVFDTHGKGASFPAPEELSLLKDGGTMVLNASSSASQGMPNFSVYAASKAAVRNLARGWANDLKDRKIRVNAVSPGVIVTPAYYKGGLTEEQVKGFAAQMATKIPLGRTGEADEIAKAVVFLASDDSSFVT